MRNRKISIITLIICLLFASIQVGADSMNIGAKAAILMDAKTGTVVYEKNPHEKLPPASVTKIMTILLAVDALENGEVKMDDTFTISPHTARMGGTQLWLEAGEVQTFENMLKATVIRSANDGSVALAEYLAGTEEMFAVKMNDKAKELGMENTNFVNASGLPHDDHYTTAYDIALMSRELLKYKTIHEYLTVYTDEIMVGKNKDIPQALVNTNKLINTYEGITGLKTGFTNAAGHCISASAKRDNLEFISVILGGETSNSRFEEAARLMDYGFANYESITIGRKGEVLAKVTVNKGVNEFIELELNEDSHLFLEKGKANNISREMEVPDSIDAPIGKGDVLGRLIIKMDGEEVESLDLSGKEDVEKAGFKNLFLKSIRSFLFIN